MNRTAKQVIGEASGALPFCVLLHAWPCASSPEGTAPRSGAAKLFGGWKQRLFMAGARLLSSFCEGFGPGPVGALFSVTSNFLPSLTSALLLIASCQANRSQLAALPASQPRRKVSFSVLRGTVRHQAKPRMLPGAVTGCVRCVRRNRRSTAGMCRAVRKPDRCSCQSRNQTAATGWARCNNWNGNTGGPPWSTGGASDDYCSE